MLAAVGVVLLSGAATVAAVRNEVSKLVEALHQNKPVKVAPHVLAPTYQGAPETLLLVGNDERKLTRYYHSAVLPHSNEMLLVRIDPSKPTISMLSIPRELKVPIDTPSGEVVETRINAAYTYGWENGGGTAGGVKLMLQTIKQVLGIAVNHVFVTNFTKFEHAVNDMGCTYMTVDKRYFHSNSEPGAEQYMEIDLQPGYQRVCGKQAREFVSNRHESTSLIRDARDQRFLLAVKAQYGGSIFEDREKFEDIFGKYVESTLESEEEILQLLYLLAESAGKPTRQVDFHVTLGTFDTATPEQIHEAVHSLLAGTTAIHAQKLKLAQTSHARHHAATPPSLGLSATPASTLAEARSAAVEVPFSVEAPLYQRTTAEAAPDEMRRYDIRGSDGRLYPAYVLVVQQGELGQYYDIQGTTWTDAPLLGGRYSSLTIGPRTYRLYYDGEHLATVAWFEAGAVYWVENTLTHNLSPDQMVAIARQTRPVTSRALGRASDGSPPAPVGVGGVRLPTGAAATAGRLSEIGAILGFLGLGVVALLSLFLFARQHELRTLREQMATALALEAGQRTLSAGALALHPQPPPAPGPSSPALQQAATRPPGRISYYAAGRLRSRLAAVGVALVLIAGLGVYILDGRVFASSASLSVAVLNATSVPGAAHDAATSLRSHHVHVAQIGNIQPSLTPGTHVLYPPGAHTEAREVARLLGSPTSDVEAIRPPFQRAVDHRDEIVVVLD